MNFGNHADETLRSRYAELLERTSIEMPLGWFDIVDVLCEQFELLHSENPAEQPLPEVS